MQSELCMKSEVWYVVWSLQDEVCNVECEVFNVVCCLQSKLCKLVWNVKNAIYKVNYVI